MRFSWREWFSIVLIALITGLIIGNLMYFVGADYLVPGIHLDLMTFVYILGYGTAAMVVALMLTSLTRRKGRR
jgi:hypothetical protein